MAFENFELKTAREDYEFFPGNWIEVDPNNQVSQGPIRIDSSGLSRANPTYTYRNFGSGYWSGDLEFLFDCKATALTDVLGLVMISDYPGDVYTHAINGWYRNELRFDTPSRLLLVKADSGGTASDAYSISLGISYYIRFVRIGSTLYAYIYSDSARTNLLDTLSLALTDVIAASHINTAYNYGSGGAFSSSGYIEYLNLKDSRTQPIYRQYDLNGHLVVEEENFIQDYTEVDLSNRITVSGSTIYASALSRFVSGYVYRDFGTGYFDGDFEHLLSHKVISSAANSYVNIWTISNGLGNGYNLYLNNESYLAIRIWNLSFQLQELDVTNFYSDLATLSLNADYWSSIIRDEAVGTYGTIYCYIYSDSDRTLLVDTLSIALHGSKKDYRYLYPINNWYTVTDEPGMTCYITHLDIKDSSIYQNYKSDYTETDPNNHITVGTYRIDFSGLNRKEDAWVVKDYGADYFSGDFEHKVQGTIAAASQNLFNCSFWCLSNIVDDTWALRFVHSSDALWLNLTDITSALSVNIIEYDSGNQYTDTNSTLSLDTLYYYTIIRDEAVGTYGTIYCYIYSDSDRTLLVDTLSISLHGSKKDYRYLYPLSAYNSGNSNAGYGSTEHLDIGEGFTDEYGITNRIEFEDLFRNEDAYVYKDFGEGYFSGNFDFLGEINNSSSDLASTTEFMVLANIVDDMGGVVSSGGDSLSLSISDIGGSELWYMREVDGGANYADGPFTYILNSSYYFRYKRDEAVGTYGTLYCYIYSDEARTNLLDTLSIALHSSKKNFRYLYPVQTYNDGYVNGLTGYIQNIELQSTEGAGIIIFRRREEGY